jgi:hypothetical protein
MQIPNNCQKYSKHFYFVLLICLHFCQGQSALHSQQLQLPNNAHHASELTYFIDLISFPNETKNSLRLPYKFKDSAVNYSLIKPNYNQSKI